MANSAKSAFKPAPLGETILRAIEAAGEVGQSLVDLCQATNGTEKQVRNAIDGLCGRGHEIVAWRGRYWLAEHLRGQGYILQRRTKRGRLKVVASPASARAKRRRRPPATAAQAQQLLGQLRAELGEGFDPTKIARLVVQRYDRCQRADAQYRETRARTAAELGAAQERFRETIEAGRHVQDLQAAVQKLLAVEAEWQNLEEVRARGIEERKAAREERRQAHRMLAAVVEDVRQLRLFDDVDDDHQPAAIS